ncbi:hypothetical protein GUITHDRAFT_110513 [Guillardia theta CCMP2712]|uniref:Cytochrome b561 domain-containing protein n=1 Tax=Guillardia theta (strain CCMP2712) TaxID=905079 RepID=L1J4G7_GUITC|nr:hypothetical protein GUITHDRAFT_110513 [Guillardia theta CCMP2712]EKX43391.1 hypothetical protein GUITHDRAFT_110513 [Guillardia theta CCMP2712]|eukprot:XP_005830371.1 hypothetical protein GUITHDRAFT_110513 [Guillardia theta CCMP2712]
MFGLLTVAGIVMQMSIGWLKYQSVSTSGQKVHRWHGTSGFVVHTLGIVALLLGAREVLSVDNIYFIIIAVCAVLVWLMVVLLRLFASFPDSHEEFAYTKQ